MLSQYVSIKDTVYAMILDSSKVSLADGQLLAAADVYPGNEVVSYNQSKMARAQILDRKMASSNDVIGLVLSNGQKLCGCRKQTVAVQMRDRIRFRELSEIKIGDLLRGERAGMPVIVRVVGLLFFPRKDVRLVEFEIKGGRPFVAEGILCR
jgi:hypothetical protein